jgi:GAF domain-containing protein
MVESEHDDTFNFKLYKIHRKVLELAIRGGGLAASMELLCHEIEQVLKDQGGLCSILLLDGRHLKHCAAPSLPKAYCDAIDGVEIGDGTGSCGTALYRREQVIVSDIASDPLWKDFKDLAKKNGLRACWSNPIIASDGTALASFAIYYPKPLSPSPTHLYLIDAFSALALLVIDHYRMSEKQSLLSGELQKTNARLGAIIEVMPDVAMLLDEGGYYINVFGNTELLVSGQLK